MCVDIYIYIYIYPYTHIYTHTHTHTHTHIYTIIIKLHLQQRFPDSLSLSLSRSLSLHPYYPSPQTGLLGSILCLHRADESRSLLVGQNLYVHAPYTYEFVLVSPAMFRILCSSYLNG